MRWPRGRRLRTPGVWSHTTTRTPRWRPRRCGRPVRGGPGLLEPMGVHREHRGRGPARPSPLPLRPPSGNWARRVRSCAPRAPTPARSRPTGRPAFGNSVRCRGRSRRGAQAAACSRGLGATARRDRSRGTPAAARRSPPTAPRASRPPGRLRGALASATSRKRRSRWRCSGISGRAGMVCASTSKGAGASGWGAASTPVSSRTSRTAVRSGSPASAGSKWPPGGSHRPSLRWSTIRRSAAAGRQRHDAGGREVARRASQGWSGSSGAQQGRPHLGEGAALPRVSRREPVEQGGDGAAVGADHAAAEYTTRRPCAQIGGRLSD